MLALVESGDRSIEAFELKVACCRDTDVFAESSETEGFVGELAEKGEEHR